MSNNHIEIYHINNQQVCIEAYFKKSNCSENPNSSTTFTKYF